MPKWKKVACEECGQQFESNSLLFYWCPNCGHFALIDSVRPTVIGFCIFIGLVVILMALAGLGFLPSGH
jgi:DNA-directed RNA polymerase subunit RPC12/RpoP